MTKYKAIVTFYELILLSLILFSMGLFYFYAVRGPELDIKFYIFSILEISFFFLVPRIKGYSILKEEMNSFGFKSLLIFLFFVGFHILKG